jgi:hypothetical protein
MDAVLGTVSGAVVGGPALKAPPPALPLPPTTALPLPPWPPPAANASASVLRAVLCAMVLWGNAVRAVLWVAGVSDRGAVLGSAGGGGAAFSDESSGAVLGAAFSDESSVVEVAPGGAVLGASSSDSSSSVGAVARAPS